MKTRGTVRVVPNITTFIIEMVVHYLATPCPYLYLLFYVHNSRLSSRVSLE